MQVEVVYKTDKKTVKIASGQPHSDRIRVAGFGRGNLELPTLTGTVLAVEVSSDGDNFSALYDAGGTAITIAKHAAAQIPAAAFGSPWIRLTSNQNEAAD